MTLTIHLLQMPHGSEIIIAGPGFQPTRYARKRWGSAPLRHRIITDKETSA